MMFRLAHLSDVHLGPLPQVSYRELASKRVTGYINWRRNRQSHLSDGVLDALIADLHAIRPDHIAVTGDIVNLSLDLEFANATKWLQRLGDAGRVSVIPGNHDAYVPGALARACAAWMPWMTGDNVTGDNDTGHDAKTIFPYLRQRGPVALIGLSSATATAPFSATGRFGRRQALRLGSILDETGRKGLFRVVMIHHPPVPGAAERHKRLYGIARFQHVIAGHGCELVLHGHTHLATVHHIAGPNASVPVIGVPSASQGPGGRKPAARYNLFEISAKGDRRVVRMIERGIAAGSDGIVQVSDRILTG